MRSGGHYFIPGTGRTYCTLNTCSINPVLRIGADYNKAVVEQSRQIGLLRELRGPIDDWTHIDPDVLLEGEIHLHQRLGFTRFTTPKARDALLR